MTDDKSQALLELVISFDGEFYCASLDIPNSYTARADTPLRAMMSWICGVQDGIKKYRLGKIEFGYFIERLGIPSEVAHELLDKEQVFMLDGQRSKLDKLYELNQSE